MTTALLSVSDKTGIVEFARALHALRRAAAVHRRHRAAAGRSRPARHRSGRGHRLPRDARRPRQDAAPAHPRRPAGAARPARAHGGAATSTASARSTCWWSTSTRSRRPRRRPDCTLEDAIENIDIGGPAMLRAAAKNWPDVAVVIDPADYARVLAELRRRRPCTREHQASAGEEGLRPHRRLRRHDHQLPERAGAGAEDAHRRGAGTRAEYPAVFNLQLTRRRTCATARTRTRARPSTASAARPRARWRSWTQLQGKEL